MRGADGNLEPDDRLKRHPRGIYVLCAAEAFQRIAYFGARGLLLLFLTVPPAAGGFGWSEGDALRFSGWFVGLYLAAPLAGGLLADRALGHRRAVLIGAGVMVIGYLALAAAVDWTELVNLVGPGTAVNLAARGGTLGLWGTGGPDARAHTLIYLVFYGGITLIVLGNGLFQTNSMSLIDRVYTDRPALRDSGFTLHYVAASIGALASALVVGTLGELISWKIGFAAAAAAMLLALIALAVGHRDLPSRAQATHLVVEDLTPPQVARGRLVVLLLLMLAAMLFTIAYEQSSGFLAIFARDSVDRDFLGFEIPATWLPQLPALYGLLLGLVAVRYIDRLAGTRLEPSVPEKFAFGFALAAIMCVVMLGAFAIVDSDGRSSMLWLIVAMLLIELGSVALWPVGFSVASRLAPRRHTAVALSVWLLVAASFGSLLAGYTGAWFLEIGPDLGFAILAAISVVIALALILTQHKLGSLAADQSFSGRHEIKSILPLAQANSPSL